MRSARPGKKKKRKNGWVGESEDEKKVGGHHKLEIES